MQSLLVDSHCHLDRLALDGVTGGLPTLLAAAREDGVGHMLCVSIDLDTFPNVLGVARTYPQVFASVGIHPNARCAREPDIEELLARAADDRVIAIGETGLDYYRSEGDLEWQRERFRRHIAVARATGKPLIVHSRDAAADTLRLLREERAAEVGGVMHCFVDSWEVAQACIDLNFYISLSGIVTFKNAPIVHDVARRVPLDRLLVETDAPYLAPVPHRGESNQPAFVRYVAERIASLREIPFRTVADATTHNFFELFKEASPVITAPA